MSLRQAIAAISLILVGLTGVGGILWIATPHWLFRALVTSVLFISVGVVFSYMAVSNFQSGVAATRYASFRRQFEPVGFWLTLAMWAAFGLGGFASGIWALFAVR
jgi:hypothetical protein